MRYGARPVVRRTGGLNDTVFDVQDDVGRAEQFGLTPNGFQFEGTDEGGIDYALNRGIDYWYNNRRGWHQLAENAMRQDWSWTRPCLAYQELYHAARKAPKPSEEKKGMQ
mmetsp:Transcript_11318/g.37237  ORF Transcript_11318/g.37237 Transcript_11318/m.37237 type:complete len:110 (-) Transcript_11318:64-393(-)